MMRAPAMKAVGKPIDAAGGAHKFVTLDGMRGIAAICVLLYHCTNATSHLAGVAYAAVDIFFALSGFVIAYSYEGRLSALGFSSFMRARLIRLYPLYLLGLVFGLVAAVSTHAAWIADGHLGAALALGLLFLPDLVVGAIFPLNNPAWSLFFELAVNGLYAVLRPGFRWLAALIAATGLLYAGLVIRNGHALGAEPETFWGGFPRVVFSFYCGVALYRLWQAGMLPSIRVPPLMICGLLFLCLFLSLPGWHGPQYFLIVFLLGPLLLVAGCQNEPSGLVASICRWLGMISYGLYTLHDPLRQIIEHIAGRQDLATTLATLVTATAAAQLATSWVDRPVRQILSGKRARVVAPHSQVSNS